MDITLNKYYFQGTRFVPGYNDIDFDDCEITAPDEKTAWEELFKFTKKWTWQRVSLTHINGVKIIQEPKSA
jgi:hypothetical protein